MCGIHGIYHFDRQPVAPALLSEMGRVTQHRGPDDEGLHVTIDGAEKTLPVDHVVICAGQEPLRDLQDDLVARGCSVRLIGGADVAAELDAKRAIDQGVRLAAAI